MERKLKIFKMVAIAIESMVLNDGLPEGVDSFFELVRQYSARVVPDLTEGELNEIIQRPLIDQFSLGEG
jgi:hypothetical protein